jgi:hypothetical protein
MSRAHLLIAPGLLLVQSACSSAQQPARDAASRRVSTQIEARPRDDRAQRSPAPEWTPEPVVEGSPPLDASALDASPPLPEEDASPPLPEEDVESQTLVEAMVACKRLQNNRELPVGCRTEFVDDVPTLVLGFESAADAARYSSAMDAQLSLPFCEAAYRAGRTAALFALTANSARQFDCEHQQWGAWFELSTN